MAHQRVPSLKDTETMLSSLGPKVFNACLVIGLIGLAAALGLGLAEGDNLRHFGFSYLVNFAFFLSISLGALFFLAIMFITKASWNVVIRRLAEVIAAIMPLLGLLAIPVILLAGQIYGWAQPDARTSHAMAHKAAFLSKDAFIIRWAIYFAIWSAYGLFYWRTSVKQDGSGDVALTRRLENYSGHALVVCSLATSLAAMDLLMSIDFLWFSTIFGVYYWTGGFVTFFAVLTLITLGLQSTGRLTKIVSMEHYHDYGKLMFGFTFFWGYIAFSQYMLYWYANIPEETAWYMLRSENGWGWVALAVLFGTFLAPFCGLLSVQAKRNLGMMAFWAAWIIVAQWVNLYWVVMPEFSHSFTISIMDLAAFFGVGGIWLAGITRLAMGTSLVPLKDPRLEESLRFENV
ncbi:MAG: quinol:cytochrome C oxidoreductase [bacterium]|nr:quinol:cytochrome C oxidoreductase [bacterium]